ncbi:MAG: hypothetical protein JNM86_05110 [Phycisphaerae bacterium]|nr:hypothetical protein [Phycisphaerae bacterium]
MNSHGSSRDRRTARFDPVPIFFGPTAPGPFALLGLDVGEHDAPAIFQALHARLARLAAHPQAATPAGEEVALALHAAAAQLCDPAIRRVLIHTWNADAASALPTQPMPLGEIVMDSNAGAIERDLHLAVGLSGGWNSRAMERLAIACRSRGVDLDAAVRGLQWRSVPNRSRQTRDEANRQQTAAPRPTDAPRTRRGRRRSGAHAAKQPHASMRRGLRDAVILAVLGATGVLCLAVAIIFLSPGGRPPLPVQPAAGESAVAAPLPFAPSAPPQLVENERANPDELESGDPRIMTQELVGATQDLATDAGAAHARFARAYRAFGRSWPLLNPDEVSAVVSAIVDFCYGASRIETPTASTITAPLQGKLASGRFAVREAAAAASISGRLLSERELPRAFLDQIEAGATLGDDGPKVEPSSAFRVGLERNLTSIAGQIARVAPASSESWKGFIEVRDAALGDRLPARDVSTLNAIEMLLRSTSLPPRDLVRSIGVLAAALSWHPSDELRMAISGWLEDTTVPAELLTEITRAMVASSAPGVDSTMVLAPGAGPNARSELRERLAQVWQGKSISTEREDFANWTTRASELLDIQAGSDAETLALAARISRTILALDALRAGKVDRANEIMVASGADTPTTPAPQPPATLPRPDPASKALEYAAAGNSVQGRLEALKQIHAANAPPDTLLAELLVTESARGTPAAIRDLARTTLRRHALEPSILLATLRALPSIPETAENAEWVAEVAAAGTKWSKRSKWKTQAQIALLDRAIAVFPASQAEAAIDLAASELATSWFERVGDGAKPASDDPNAAIESLEAAMASAARSPRGGAPAGLNPAEIRRRLAARKEIAPGPLELAVARQGACVEWTALGVAQERPGDIGAVQQIIEQWNTARRKGGSSIDQLLEGERAVLRLQLLRIGAKARES